MRTVDTIAERLRSSLSMAMDALTTRIASLFSGAPRLYLGKGVYLAIGSRIQPRTEIGDYTRINGPIAIRGSVAVTIGKYCAIGQNVRLISDTHITNRPAIQVKFYWRFFREHLIQAGSGLIIGNDVWVGDSVTVLQGATIGDGAIVGTGSVVTKDVPPYTVVGGVPAKKIRERFPPRLVEQLIRIKWWDWPVDKIRGNRVFFMLNLNEEETVELEEFIH